MIKTLINVIKSFISGRSWVVDIIVFILQLWPFFLMCVMGAQIFQNKLVPPDNVGENLW